VTPTTGRENLRVARGGPPDAGVVDQITGVTVPFRHHETEDEVADDSTFELTTRGPVPPAAQRARWDALLAGGGPVLADGAMGTMLFTAGLQFGDPPEMWNVAQPQGSIVRQIHRAYLDAGSRIILTNTFGGNRLRLSLHSNERHVGEINQMAVVLARAEIDAAGGSALVAGDIGPTGSIMFPMGLLPYDEAVEVFAEQAAGLVAGGVDLIWIETMSDLDEIHAAIEGVRRVAPEIPIIATMTFDTRGHTMMGVSPERAVHALIGWGADAIGGNCGNGPNEIIPVIAKMRAAAPDALLVAKSNAGMPELVDMKAVYKAEPPVMAEYALDVRNAGASIIGACCGSTPAHLSAMAVALGVDRAG
jgi:5-methyltetrahydrofolate--homocysteine methyltransferase